MRTSPAPPMCWLLSPPLDLRPRRPPRRGRDQGQVNRSDTRVEWAEPDVGEPAAPDEPITTPPGARSAWPLEYPAQQRRLCRTQPQTARRPLAGRGGRSRSDPSNSKARVPSRDQPSGTIAREEASLLCGSSAVRPVADPLAIPEPAADPRCRSLPQSQLWARPRGGRLERCSPRAGTSTISPSSSGSSQATNDHGPCCPTCGAMSAERAT